jgi:formylglycine-generating enzyme required for sulfatase activity
MNAYCCIVLLSVAALAAQAGRVTVANVTAAQQPGAPLVDIYYDLLNPSGGLHTVAIDASTNAGAAYHTPCTSISGAAGAGVSTGVHKHAVWYAAGDLPGIIVSQARVRVTAIEEYTGGTDNYCIVDISGGPAAAVYPVTYEPVAPPLDATHKTGRIVLRKIPSGTFTMGSPTGELGRSSDETQRAVTLTRPHYFGVFEITQAQYSNVMGANPACFATGADAPLRPVERVSWNDARGGTWPGGTPSSASFIGTLRHKTGLALDLPTEAQWEYACRAGAATAFNNDRAITNSASDASLNAIARYWYSGGSNNAAHAAVGAYQPNQWGLYDLHGNVAEWCLDWYGSYSGSTDPAGPASGAHRVIRGGGWVADAGLCRAAYRADNAPGGSDDSVGVRVAAPAQP